MTDYQPDIMIYHANCADGFGAAWAAWLKWGDKVQYVPASYGDAPPDVLGKHVLIGDFSYKADGIRSLAGAVSVVILDHHKTALAELEPYRFAESSPGAVSAADVPGMLRDLATHNLPPIIAIFDMDRSGAHMVWDFCFPGESPPPLVQLIEDRDLWRFTLPDTKAFNLWLRAEPFDFERWELIAQELNDDKGAASIMAEAAAMQRFFDQKVDEIARRVRHMRIGGHVVPAVNCPPEFCSEVAHAVLERHGEAAFAACYWDTREGRSFSLRSDSAGQHRLDVSAIAASYGGGGHRNAAGFSMPLP